MCVRGLIIKDAIYLINFGPILSYPGALESRNLFIISSISYSSVGVINILLMIDRGQ